jgi:hypothetical protein
MEIKPKQVIYEKTQDANIIIKNTLKQEYIHKDKLVSQIAELEKETEVKPKVVPDEETLALWNSAHATDTKKEEELNEKKDILASIESLSDTEGL